MSQAMPDKLQQLRDIHLPDPPGWWPPAVGWWILGLAILAAVVGLVYAWRYWQSKRAPLKQALAQLDELHQAFLENRLDAVAYADQADRLIKRVLIHAGHRRDVARLSGQAWVDYLSSILDDPEFSTHAGRALGDQRFEPHPDLPVEALHGSLRKILTRLIKST